MKNVIIYLHIDFPDVDLNIAQGNEFIVKEDTLIKDVMVVEQVTETVELEKIDRDVVECIFLDNNHPIFLPSCETNCKKRCIEQINQEQRTYIW